MEICGTKSLLMQTIKIEGLCHVGLRVAMGQGTLHEFIIVKVTELSAEFSRMKAVLGHLEAERTSQDVWLKERLGSLPA